MSRAAKIFAAPAVAAALMASLAACEPADTPLAPELQSALTLLGTEPFWSVEIDVAGRTTFLRLDDPDVSADRVTRKATADGAQFSTQADGEPLEITLKKETCSDGMSDRVYPYAAEVTWQGRAYVGCAIRPEDMRPE